MNPEKKTSLGRQTLKGATLGAALGGALGMAGVGTGEMLGSAVDGLLGQTASQLTTSEQNSIPTTGIEPPLPPEIIIRKEPPVEKNKAEFVPSKKYKEPKPEDTSYYDEEKDPVQIITKTLQTIPGVSVKENIGVWKKSREMEVKGGDYNGYGFPLGSVVIDNSGRDIDFYFKTPEANDILMRNFNTENIIKGIRQDRLKDVIALAINTNQEILSILAFAESRKFDQPIYTKLDDDGLAKYELTSIGMQFQERIILAQQNGISQMRQFTDPE